MKAHSILAALFILTTSALAHAGGPPPMYVVVDKVVFEPEKRVPGWVQIWGSFTRYEKSTDDKGKEVYAYTKPTYGYVYLSLDKDGKGNLQEELQEWKSAVGTGKAVAVGICGDAGSMLKAPIHLARETAGQPDATYTTGFLKLSGDLYANEHLSKQPEVASLLKYAKERK